MGLIRGARGRQIKIGLRGEATRKQYLLTIFSVLGEVTGRT